MLHRFPYPEVPSLEIPDSLISAVYRPKRMETSESEAAIIQRAFSFPIGTPGVAEMAKGARSALILVDDYTRLTPAHLIVPRIISELKEAGVQKILVMIALGTHRAMTRAELEKKLGPDIVASYEVRNHEWNNVNELVNLGTEEGIDIEINRAVLEADFIIGVGHIVPHRIAGYSGGGKIIQPGVCGNKTTGQTHWLSAHYKGSEILGRAENPVRDKIDRVALKAGLAMVANAVQDQSGKVVGLFVGHPVEAYRRGAELSRQVYGVPVKELVDVVVCDAYPSDNDFWVGGKPLHAADIIVRQGGAIVLVAPCRDGVSREHPDIIKYGYRSWPEVKALVDGGVIADLTLASHLVHVGRVTAERAKCILVPQGIDRETTERLGLLYAETPQEAFQMACRLVDTSRPKVAILEQGGELLPLVDEA